MLIVPCYRSVFRHEVWEYECKVVRIWGMMLSAAPALQHTRFSVLVGRSSDFARVTQYLIVSHVNVSN